MNVAELSKARLRRVDKPKEAPSLIKEVNSNTPADLSRLRVLNLEPRRFDQSTESWITAAIVRQQASIHSQRNAHESDRIG